MRILCVADEYPWPATSGYRIRLAGLLAALTAFADVELFCTVDDRPELASGEWDAPPHGLRRIWLEPREPLGSSPAGLLRWARSGWPRAVALRDWRAAEGALAAFRRDPYDLVWFSHGEVWLALAREADRPALVDLDNLESEILRAHALDPGPVPPGAAARLRAAVRRRADALDERRWRQAEARAAVGTDGVLLCSQVDVDRLDHPNGRVVPNGYDEQPRPDAPSGPVLAMASLLLYRPNLDGATWFATEVLPRVRREVPDARLRLIGRHDEGAAPLGQLPGVELTGEVDDVGDALRGAAAVVVPLHAGSGTRIKVIEAFARRLPVASTTLGCEGLGAVAGTHVLVGDSPEALAEACVTLLTDPDRAAAVATAGWALWDERFRWSAIQAEVRRIVEAAAAT